MLFWKIIIGSLATAGSLHAVMVMNKDKVDRFFMAFFRDLGRYKARKRRHANSNGLIVTLLGKDNPMDDLLLQSADDQKVDDLPTYTTTELFEFGSDERLLLSIFGRVYDVSAGKRFYGPGSTYEAFAGRDVTYALCTGCRTEECMEKSVDELDNTKLLEEGKRWLSFFHLHDKYPLVGKLETDHLEELMKDLLEKEWASVEEESKEGGTGDKPLMPPILEEKESH